MREAWIADAGGPPRGRLARVEPARRRLQRAGAGAHVARRAARRTCTRCPTGPTGSRTAPPTTPRTGASASAQRQLDALPDGEYEVCIDSTLAPGHLTYGELLVPGRTRRRDPALGARLPPFAVRRQPLRASRSRHALAQRLAAASARGGTGCASCSRPAPSARSPGSRGTASARRARPARAHARLPRRRASRFTYKRTLDGDGRDRPRGRARAARPRRAPHQLIDFFPYGYDERQYNSPGFRLPVGSLMRAPARAVPRVPHLGRRPRLRVAGEPGRVARGGGRDRRRAAARRRVPQPAALTASRSSAAAGSTARPAAATLPGLELAMLWVLSLSDGSRSLLGDRRALRRCRSGTIRAAADRLLAHELLEPVAASPGR